MRNLKTLVRVMLLMLCAPFTFANPGAIFNVPVQTLCAKGYNYICAAPQYQVRVCAEGTYAGLCASPVTLYTDDTLGTTSANPFSPDVRGNATFYTNPGAYTVQIQTTGGVVLYQYNIGSGSATTTVPLSSLTAASGTNTLSNGDNAQFWNWTLTTSGKSAMTISENVASTAGGTPYLLNIHTLGGSTLNPFIATAQGTANGVRMNTSGVLSAIGTGGITATSTSLNINTSSPLSGGGAFNANLTLSCPTCVATGQANSYTAGPQDLNTVAQTIQVGNASVTGTTAHSLAKMSSTGAVIAATTDTSVPVYIVDSGAGTAGNAKLAIAGLETCTMDATASNVEGYFVIASTTTGGQCHALNTVPSGSFVVGTMVSNSITSGSTATVAINPYYVNTAGGGSGTVNSGTAGQLAYYATSTSAVSGNANVTVSSGAMTLGVAGSAAGSLKLSGATSGTTTLAVAATTSGTLTVPAATDTLVARATTDTLTNKTFNAEGTGNALSVPSHAYFQAAACNNTTAGASWDIGVANTPTPVCVGSNTRKGALQYARGNVAYFSFFLPADWNSGANVDIRIGYTTTDSTNGHVTAFNIQTGCNALNDHVTDDPALNTAQTASATNDGSAVSGGENFITQSALTMTGCTAGSQLVIAITRNNSGTDTNTDTAVNVKWAELVFGRTMNASNR